VKRKERVRLYNLYVAPSVAGNQTKPVHSTLVATIVIVCLVQPYDLCRVNTDQWWPYTTDRQDILCTGDRRTHDSVLVKKRLADDLLPYQGPGER